MVEINNQRKAFLDMLAWSEELITDVKQSWLWRHCRRSYLLITPITLANLSLNKNSNQQAPDATSFFPVGQGCHTASSLAWKTSLRKVRTLWHCSRLRSVALYLWLIVVIIRQAMSSDLQQISISLPVPLVMTSSSKATAWLPNWSGGFSGQRWCMSRSICLSRSGYLHHRLPVMGC